MSKPLLHGWYVYLDSASSKLPLGFTEGRYTEGTPTYIIKEPSSSVYSTAWALSHKAVFSLPREFLS